MNVDGKFPHEKEKKIKDILNQDSFSEKMLVEILTILSELSETQVTELMQTITDIEIKNLKECADKGPWWKCPSVWRKIHKQRKRKSKKKDSVMRIDYNSLDESASYMTIPMQRTSEGYLKGKAVITNVGVFTYQKADGSVTRELRPPEEVFHPDSLNSLKMKPITNEHPSVSVNTENIKEFQVGNLGNTVEEDSFHVSSSILITDENTIGEIQAGKAALSAGYSVDIEYTDGVWMGVPYDAIQRNIRYNHVAVVDKGRAGDAAVLRFDSIDPNLGILKIDEQNFNKGENKSMLKKFKIDGVEYEAEVDVIKAYTQLDSENKKFKEDHATEIETLKKDKDTITAERDQLKEENEQLKKDKENTEKTNPEVIEKAVQSRLVVLDAAKRADIEIKPEMSEDEIKKEVIIKLFPNSKEKLDNCSPEYLVARFDFALENLETVEAEKKEVETQLSNDSISKTDSTKDKFDSDKAYQRMVERNQNAWKSNLKEDE